MTDGSVWTGSYLDWEKMSESDKNKTVIETRKNKKGGNTPTKKQSEIDLKVQLLAERESLIAAMQFTPSVGRADRSN
jgi:hypothetical protein